MADAPPPADGWSRITLTSKLGVGRDFEVSDASGARLLVVDGKVGTTPKAEVRDAQDQVLPGLVMAVVWAIDRWVERD